ncbi:iron-sulfur cluster assembly scaffold protein [Microvirga solisilvae]|uniref:iron-sulfur cluster assembly scaffold protein n=1 Tax=Microvirga solisilvae TaxID=2919498 RepID=UPI001FAF60B3|nr:iron-sulfur cluster assembly scaffold protein [Microvirga solisilvae]
MLNDIYSRRILELAADIPLQGILPDADAGAKAHSKLCGSTVTVQLKLDGDVVSGFAHEVKACALGQASSSIMARHVIGSTVAELRNVREEMQRMLKAGGKPPSGKWAELALLEPARDLKARHASILLTFDAVADALAQIEAARKSHLGNE